MVEAFDSIAGSNPPTSNSAQAPGVAQNPNVYFWYSMYASNQAGSSSLDHEWGHVFEKSHKMKKKKKKKKKKRKDVGSSSVVNSASDLSEALSAVSAALSLSSSSYESGENDLHQDKEDFKRLPYLVGNLDDENGDNSTEHHSSFDIQSLSSESDGDDLVLSDYNGGDVLAKPNFGVGEEMQIYKSQVPALGMVFSSEEEAYKFYQTYALKTGFRVRKGKVQRLSNGTIRKRYFFCSRQGFRSQNQSNKITKYKRKETRTGCNAKIQYTVENGKWVISQISHEHNHHPEDPRHMVGSCTKTSKAGLIFQKKNEADMTLKSLEDVNDTENRGHLEKKHAELDYKHDYGVCNQPPKPVRKGDQGLGISLLPSSFRMEFEHRSGDGGGGNQNESKVESGQAVSRASADLLNRTPRFSKEQVRGLERMFKDDDYSTTPNPRQLRFAKKFFKLDRNQVEVWLKIRKSRTKLERNMEFLKRENEFLKILNDASKLCNEHLERVNHASQRENERLKRKNEFLRRALKSLCRRTRIKGAARSARVLVQQEK